MRSQLIIDFSFVIRRKSAGAHSPIHRISDKPAFPPAFHRLQEYLIRLFPRRCRKGVYTIEHIMDHTLPVRPIAKEGIKKGYSGDRCEIRLEPPRNSDLSQDTGNVNQWRINDPYLIVILESCIKVSQKFSHVLFSFRPLNSPDLFERFSPLRFSNERPGVYLHLCKAVHPPAEKDFL